MRRDICVCLGLSLIDFGCDACQSPARAYLIDAVPPEQHQKAFSVMGICCGVGGSIGYLLGSINFRHTEFAMWVNYTYILLL